jgi:hypothetical protein
MNWLNNGSKTLVTCVGIAAVAVMACFEVLSADQALGTIVLMAGAYAGANLYQNGKAPAPPAEQEKTP